MIPGVIVAIIAQQLLVGHPTGAPRLVGGNGNGYNQIGDTRSLREGLGLLG
jgi:hypothetical protein